MQHDEIAKELEGALQSEVINTMLNSTAHIAKSMHLYPREYEEMQENRCFILLQRQAIRDLEKLLGLITNPATPEAQRLVFIGQFNAQKWFVQTPKLIQKVAEFDELKRNDFGDAAPSSMPNSGGFTADEILGYNKKGL